MGLRDTLADVSAFVDNNQMTHRQAALIVAAWTGGTVLFGILAFIIVFVILGY